MGVSTHSEPKTLYIFSAWTSDSWNADNIGRHEALIYALESRGIGYAQLVGKYNGKLEDSVLVTSNGMTEEQVKNWAFHSYGQECILKLTNHKHGTYKAYLVYADGREEFQGYFRSMDKATVMKLGCDYTYRVDTNEYYVIWKTDTTVMVDFDKEKQEALSLAFA